jgi:hypothetical protein
MEGRGGASLNPFPSACLGDCQSPGGSAHNTLDKAPGRN